MQPGRSVLLAGATGLVGGECLRLLIADPFFERVVTLTRRPVEDDGVVGAPKLEQHVVDFERLHDWAHVFAVNTIVCALGTTMKQAGSKQRFRRVDFDYTLEIARLGRDQGATHFLLVSSIGASTRSRFFYTRVKGELEDAIGSFGYPALTILRPSTLLGERRESRSGERLAMKLSFLTPRRYKPVAASTVARALAELAKAAAAGRRVVESPEIASIAEHHR